MELLVGLLSTTSLLLLLVFVSRSIIKLRCVTEVGKDLPRVLEIEFTVFLGKFERLLDNSHKIVVVSNFIVTSQREIFSLRMTLQFVKRRIYLNQYLEAVVRKNTSKIRVSVEVNAVHIPALSLVPVARRE